MLNATEIRLLAERIAQLSEHQRRLSEAVKSITDHRVEEQSKSPITENGGTSIPLENLQSRVQENTTLPPEYYF